MKQLSLPSFNTRLREVSSEIEIWDDFRMKWVNCTPEEWVRQHFAHFILMHLGFPKGRIAIEFSLKLHQMKRRADICVFDKEGNPFLIVECKSPEVILTNDVFEQAGRYNLVLNARYIIITNGLKHYCAEVDFSKKKWELIHEFPKYKDF